MNILNPKVPLLATLVVAGLLAGCGGSSSSTGIASFGITDAAVDNVARVQLTIDAIALKPQDGEAFTVQLATPLVIANLLDLQGATPTSYTWPGQPGDSVYGTLALSAASCRIANCIFRDNCYLG